MNGGEHTLDLHSESVSASLPLAREGILRVETPFALHHGGSLPELSIAWRLAGNLAAKLFTAQTWLSLGCGLLLLYAARAARLEAWVLAGLVLDLLVEFAAAPHIRARENLALWHGAGSAMPWAASNASACSGASGGLNR